MIAVGPTVTALGVGALLLGATGCAEQPAPGPTPAAPSTEPATPPDTGASAPTADPAVRTVEVTVAGGQVSPAPSQVDLAVGEPLRLVVTSDRDSELHAHGFDVDAAVPAGEPTAIELVGATPGVYEVELHDPDLLLLQVAVR